MKKTYTITGIELKLWKDFKAACVHYNVSMKTSFIAHMQKIVSNFDFAKWVRDATKPEQRKEGKKR